ncbi:MAG: hypothetical protein A2169_13405 [Deltaproteobacteria bacterium RBG_13_47_9]|nr:MAG: hypothetical protein A2169_13405 [Deltaproteobacteria bacterium RBG_13_47_9]
MNSFVSIVKCQNYDEEKVLDSIRQSIGLIGGIETFVKKGNRVLLKPNLLIGRSSEKAVTTHPMIIKGMIQIVREAGGIPFIGDSPSIGSLLRTAEKAGVKTVAEELKCPLVEFNKPISTPRREERTFKDLEIDQTVMDADVIINLPKWKTHAMMLLTLGVKNLFGCIPGARKALWHLKAGKDRKVFARMLVEIYQLIRPSLTVLDGIVGMEGNGPNSGRPIRLGLILASRDSLNIDQIVCDILGISRESLLTNRMALEKGMGKERIKVMGEKVEEVRISKFQLPTPSQTDLNLPDLLRKALSNALASKPIVEAKKCNRCNQCVEICPPKALIRERKDLVFDYGKCIHCFCCLEVCSEGAISIQPGWLLNFMGHLKKKERPI